MNTADLARLALAKRAFQATQPGEAEVQTGVRRARLAIGRAKPRRRWLSKGLVFVVLAVGSLAYAKPQALGELVERVLPREAANAGKRLVRGAAPEPGEAAVRLGSVKPIGKLARGATAESATAGAATRTGVGALAEAAAASATEAVAEAQRESLAEPASDQADASAPKKAAAAAARPTVVGPTAARSTAALSNPRAASAARTTDTAENTPTIAVSDWGRVGQALARGDDTAALAALNGLSESDDPRTRDKADLGRAQLLMAHGDPEKACALARSLSHRRAGGRIERQAQLLLKSCGR